MAANRSRRWYQFSLRALLFLMAIACVVPGAHVAHKSYLLRQRLAEFEDSFLWLESLGYPDVSQAQPIRITTRNWSGEQQPADAESSVSIGFLLSEDAKSFTVLTPSLVTATIERQQREQWFSSESSFERVHVHDLARMVLDQQEPRTLAPSIRFGPGLNGSGELFVLAWACARKGQEELAVNLYDAAEKYSRSGDNSDKPFFEQVADDFAHMETWRATLEFETNSSRVELLQKFRWLQKHFPKSKHAASVAKTVAILESMVAEDELHARQRAAGLPFEQLTRNEQIAELIFQLRDQNGRQWSQPGWCDVLNAPTQDSPGHRLLTYGYEAIPQLADALDDKRLTRSIGFHRNFYFSHHVLSVGAAAEQILERITFRRFDSHVIQDNRRAAHVADVRTQVLAWHAELVAKGERRCLIEAVEKGNRASLGVADRLIKIHPDQACSAILRAIPNVADDYDRQQFIELLGRVPSDESFPLLDDLLRHQKVTVRLSAAQALTALGRPEGIDAIQELWLRSNPLPAFSEMGEFLAGCGREDALHAVARRFSEQPIDGRLGSLDAAMRYEEEQLKAQPKLRAAVIHLLVTGLRDTAIRAGMSGSYGGKDFSDPRVCDLAGHHLNSLDAAAYPFDLGAPMDRRELARLQILAKQEDGQKPEERDIP